MISENLMIFDMDGVLAEFVEGTSFEELFSEGYFKNLVAIESSIQLVNLLAKKFPEKVYIGSSYLEDSPYAFHEKMEWALSRLNIDESHIILIPSSETKASYIQKYIGRTLTSHDLLIDDYGNNLSAWELAGGKAVKFKNSFNGRKGKDYKYFIQENNSPILSAFHLALFQ